MKKLALLLSLVILPLSTGLAFDLFSEDGLRTTEAYQLTHRYSYEKIRSEDYQAEEFANEGANTLYEVNVNEGFEDFKKPGIVFGKDCINWKSCLRLTFWKTNGYNRSYIKKQISGVSINGPYSWIGVRKQQNVILNGALSGKAKLMKLRGLSATREGQSHRRNN